MRLIDSDKFKDCFNTDTAIGKTMRLMIDEQPTAYAVDKVMDKLIKLNKHEKKKAAEYDKINRLDLMDEHYAKAEAYRDSIKIVKLGGIE